MKLDAANITAAVAVVMMLISASTFIYQLNRLSNQLENLSVQIEELREEIQRSDQELREDLQRRNQLLYSLANHTHDADGHAGFTVPPGMEPTGAAPDQRTPAQ